MVEVIEIDDSPPLRPITNFTNSRLSTRDTNTNSWPTDDLDNDFTLTWAEKPTKKRKVSSEVIFETMGSLDDVGVPAPLLEADDTITVRKTTITGPRSYWDSDDDDSFRFTSSRVEKIIAKGKGAAVSKPKDDAVFKPVPIDDGDSDNVPDFLDFLNSSRQVHVQVSDRTAGILAKVSKNANAGTTTKSKRSTTEPNKASPKRSKSSSARIASIERADEEPPSSQPTPKKKGRLTEAEKGAKAKERQTVKENREKEKATEKERKRLMREEQNKEKQLADDVAAVNKLKLNRKETTADMILDLSTSLYEARLGSKLQQYMLRLEVQCTSFTSPMPDIVKWRRNAYREWNEEANRWSPRPHHIIDEDHALCYLPAKCFNELVSAGPSDPTAENLDTHVLKLKSAYPNRKPIYLIEGLRTLIGNARNAQNREHQALVLQQIPGSQESQSTARRRKPTTVLSEDAIEAALVSLQLTHQVLIHHTNNTDESAEWIMHFTQHISTIESKNERQQLNLGTAFCMEAGQVNTGEDPRDTWVKMLQEVRGLKASAAYGIADRWGDVNSLVKEFREKGSLMVENVKKSANTYGGSGDTRLGPAISRRLHSIFTSMDPECTDI